MNSITSDASAAFHSGIWLAIVSVSSVASPSLVHGDDAVRGSRAGGAGIAAAGGLGGVGGTTMGELERITGAGGGRRLFAPPRLAGWGALLLLLGLLPPLAGGAARRDPLRQPFAEWSIWNLPLGRDAALVDARLHGVPATPSP